MDSESKVVALHVPPTPAREPTPVAPGVVIMRVARVEPGGGWARLVVDGVDGDVRARTTIGLTADDLDREVVVLPNVDPAAPPVIVGRLVPVNRAQDPVRVEVDGEEVTVSGGRRVTLRCGAATIELHANGRISINGENITSHAKRTNRLLGGQVQLN